MKIEGLLTTSEIAERWGINSSTIRKAIAYSRIKPTECTKIGKTWLVEQSAVERLYGKEKARGN